MSKYIVEKRNIYNHAEYLESFDTENNTSSFNLNRNKALLISEDEKKIVKRIFKKSFVYNVKFIKLEKFDMIHDAAMSSIEEKGYDDSQFVKENPAKYLRNEDDLSLECIALAKTDLEGISNFKEFGEKASEIIIEKFNLQKKVW